MSVELEEVRDFLATAAPFSHLPYDDVALASTTMGIIYVRRGDTIIDVGAENETCYIIRSGAVDVLDSEGTLLDRREAGRSFGYSTVMAEGASRYQMVAVEDSLLLTLPQASFMAIADKYDDFRRFFSSQSKRINAAANSLRQDQSNDILRTRLGDFMITTPATVSSDSTIQTAAQMMQEKNVSSLLILEDDTLQGILTDRDLRRKVVAVNLDVTLPVADIMTTNPRVATSDTRAFEAMIVMSELGIHHLPVVDEGKLTGIVSSPDIMRLLRNDPIYVTADLARKTDPEELREVFKSADDVAVRFIERGAAPEEVCGLLTVAADSLARRLLTLGEEKFGAPPVPYAFVVVGSQGRRGMGLASDQDNCLVLSNDYNEQEHGQYFADLSEFVCKGLDDAGQVLCPGEMMAMTPKWRMSQKIWIDTFREWITAPEPDNLLHVQTFFDFRPIHGDLNLATEVHNAATEMAQSASRMHAHLATLAARREPPLGFFRGFVVDRSGEYANTLDVKKGGIAAIVQMARLFALSSGVNAIGTRQRLEQSAGQGAVSKKGAQDLIDAFDFLNLIALDQQAEQVRRGDSPDYHLDPNALGKMDREHLRDAFQIIKSMQTALSTKYPVRNI
jgi:hypothetical protein